MGDIVTVVRAIAGAMFAVASMIFVQGLIESGWRTPLSEHAFRSRLVGRLMEGLRRAVILSVGVLVVAVGAAVGCWIGAAVDPGYVCMGVARQIFAHQVLLLPLGFALTFLVATSIDGASRCRVSSAKQRLVGSFGLVWSVASAPLVVALCFVVASKAAGRDGLWSFAVVDGVDAAQGLARALIGWALQPLAIVGAVLFVARERLGEVYHAG